LSCVVVGALVRFSIYLIFLRLGRPRTHVRVHFSPFCHGTAVRCSPLSQRLRLVLPRLFWFALCVL